MMWVTAFSSTLDATYLSCSLQAWNNNNILKSGLNDCKKVSRESHICNSF